MKIIPQSYEIIDKINGVAILKKIERIGRICYASEDKMTDDSYMGFVKGLLARGHESVIEHVSVTVKFVTNRRVSHELVRHRLCSFSQSSQRYIDYQSGVEFIDLRPHIKHESSKDAWPALCVEVEENYKLMRGFYDDEPEQPEIAGGVLSNDVATTIVVTANLRQWRHILNLRVAGTTGRPHPQMKEALLPLLKEFQVKIPTIFDDIEVK